MFIRVSLPKKMTFPDGPLKGNLQLSAAEKKLWQLESARRLLLSRLDNPMAHQSTRDEITELIETIDLLIPVADDKIKQYKELARSKDDLRLDELFNFSERLIAGRLRLGWSQAQLAQRMGVTRQNLTKYEATFYKGVTFGRMSQIAKILHEALRKVEHSQHS